jgi:hypothetical protein
MEGYRYILFEDRCPLYDITKAIEFKEIPYYYKKNSSCYIAEFLNEDIESIYSLEYFVERNATKILKIDGDMIQYVKKSHRNCLTAVSQNGFSIRHIKKPSYEIRRKAIETDPGSLLYITDKTKKLCKLAVELDPSMLHFVDDQDADMCLSAIRKDPRVIMYVKIPLTYEMCLLAVSSKGRVIYYIPKIYIDYSIKEQAVMNDGTALQFIDIQDENLCIHAVKNDPMAIFHVKNQTKNIVTEVVKRKGFLIKFIDPNLVDDELKMLAVKQNGLSLRFISKNQTPKICLEAIKNNTMSIKYVRYITPDIIKYIAVYSPRSLKLLSTTKSTESMDNPINQIYYQKICSL